MPQNITLAAFVLGAILLLVALTTGGVKIFGAEVSGSTGRTARIFAGVLGALLLAAGLWGAFRPDVSPPPKYSASSDNSQIEESTVTITTTTIPTTTTVISDNSQIDEITVTDYTKFPVEIRKEKLLPKEP